MFIRKMTAKALTFFLILAAFPFNAAASALEATSSGINVLGLPTPVITGIDAKNSIVQLKAEGYINDNANLLATVALVNENGDVVDVAEKKVSDPENIRISLHLGQIKVGDSIFAKFTNHGIEGDGADRTHEENEPEPEIPSEPEPEASSKPEPEAPPSTQIIIERGRDRSSTSYIVTQADPEQVIVEKLIEMEPEPAANVIRNIPVYIYTGPDNAQNVEEPVDSVTHEITAEDMVVVGELLESTKTESEIIKPVSANAKILLSLIIILILCLIILIVFMVRFYLSKSFSEIRQPLNFFDSTKQINDEKTA